MTLIRYLRENWKIFASWVAAMTALATIYAFVATPVYRAILVAAPVTSDSDLSGRALLGDVGNLIGLGQLLQTPTDRTQEYLAVLESRAFIQAFIREHELMPVLFPGERLQENGGRTIGEGYEKFHVDILQVVQDSKSGLVTIKVDWTDSSQAAEWANALIARLNSDVRSRAVKEADTNLQFLNKELERTSATEIRDSIFALIKSQIQKIMLANVRVDYALRVIDPAIAPDKSDVQRPKKVLVILIGMLFGLFAAAAQFILLSESVSATRPTNSKS